MMNILLFIFTVIFNFAVISSRDSSHIYGGNNSNNINGNSKMANRNTLISSHNITYIEKAENVLRVPVISKYIKEHKSRRKSLKKSPKSTIQKIIKKHRSKTKKLYLHQVTSHPTQSPVKAEYDNVYAQEESQWNDDSATTQGNQKRKPRKWNSKIARYPMPFQKLQKKDNYKFKRSVNRDDFYIINDLDEIEFVNTKENDYSIVNAHVQNHW